MTARIIECEAEVSVGAQTWKFALDARRGTVSVEMEGTRFTLRAQTWQEKRMLARFAHLGEPFLEDQFLRICVDRDQVPDSGPEREALLALARWLNAPGGKAGLPLDQQLLAGITLQVCRAIHTIPQTFDGLEAADVELLWQAARAGAPATEEQASANRIVVVPDTSEAGTASERPASAKGVEQSGTPVLMNTSKRVSAHEPVAAVESVANALRVENGAGVRGEPARATVPVRTPPRHGEEPGAATAHATTSRFRLRFGSHSEQPIHPAGPRVTVASAAHRVDPASYSTAIEGAEMAQTLKMWPVQNAGSSRVSSSEQSSGFSSVSNESLRRPDMTEPGAGGWGPPQRAARALEPRTCAPVHLDREHILEELAERLEQAVAEQGIDPEQ